jgi:hypothetical protein
VSGWVDEQLRALLRMRVSASRGGERTEIVVWIDWFGNCYETQMAASDGQYPVLGTVVLAGHHLDINYGARTVVLT